MSKIDALKEGVAFRAGIWYVISSIMVKSISIITTPIFARLMTTDEYGMVATFTSWHALLITFCTLNLSYSIGRAKLDFEGKLDEYIGSMQLLSAMVSLVLTILGTVFLKQFSHILELNSVSTVLLLIYLLFGPAITFKQNGYRYRYQYKQNIMIAWYTALSTVVISLILMLTQDGDKAILRMLGITIPTVFLSIVFWVKSIRKKQIHFNKEYWKYGLVLSGPLILHTISMNILSQSDRIFISKICGTSDSGIYSLVYNYGLLLSIVMGAVSEGWLPWFHDNFYNKNYIGIQNNTKKMVVFSCYVGLACIAFAPEAILILGGEQYISGMYCVPPIVLGVVCQNIYTHYVNIEMHLKKTKYVSQGTIIAAILNIILNVIFIPKFGYVAAAYTTLASYGVLFLIHFLITRFILKIKLYDDWFMFGAMAGTIIVTYIVACSYQCSQLRYVVIFIGFVSFLWVFRDYLRNFISVFFIKVKRKHH